MSETASTRTVLVTGSSRGIGRAVALSLADAGYDVVVHCRASQAQAEEVCREIEAKGRKARLLTFDVTDRQAAREALEADCEAHGAYWGVVLNAGIHRDAPLVGLEEDDWDSVLKTDLDAFYNVLKPVLLPMCRKRRGRVVVMSSVSGLYGTRGQTNYSAAKAGLIGAAKALAMELASRGITVNAVAPGLIDTSMGFLSPLGNDWPTVREALYENRSAVRHMTDWDETDLNTRVAAPVAPYSLDPELFSRKRTRAMGRVALMAVKASYDALVDAGLLGHPVLTSGDCGVAYGSSAGQPAAVAELANLILTKTCRGITATTYVRMMSHTAAVNIGIYFGLKGRIIPTSSACTSGSQGIGMAYEAIRYGKQKVMIAGGSEELDATDAAIFDTLFATSCRYNDTPELTPRPFDKDRDGLVVGEGAGSLVLESLSHAKARGAKIYAEVLGFGENSDGVHITTPQSEQMGRAMELALEDAGIRPEDVDCVNGHGTATDRGDVAESHATARVFGDRVPYTTYKGHMGHTLGACGALEAIFALRSMEEGFVSPILNLKEPDPACANLQYVRDAVRSLEQNVIMSNNFAFGGINTSLVFRRWLGE